MGSKRKPARLIEKSAVSVVGTFPSLKLGVSVRYESTLERDVLYFLEYDPRVLSYETQPMTIKMRLSDGKPHRYTPDVRVYYADGARAIVECKPASRLNKEHSQQQIEIGKRWAERNEHEFLVITDEDTRRGPRLDNLKILYRYSRLAVPHDVIARCLTCLDTASQGVTLQALLSHLSEAEPWRFKPYVFALLFHHVLKTDLDQPLGDSSVLFRAASSAARR